MNLDKRGKITLRGTIPCKKSKYRRGRTGLFLASETTADINSLILQARLQWKHGPIEHPDMVITFLVRHRKSDRDGMLSTLMDVIQKAGVIRNDNIAHCNGWIHIAPSVVGDVDGVDIDIEGLL